MNGRGQRKPLPQGLRPGELDFFKELRHVVDMAGLTTRELERRTATVREGTAAPAFYSKSQWSRWLNGQAVPPRRAVQRLAAVLEADGVDAGPLLTLLQRTAIPARRTSGEAGREGEGEEARPQRQVPSLTADFTGRIRKLAERGDQAVTDLAIALSLLAVTQEAAGDTAAARRSRTAADIIIDGLPPEEAAALRAAVERESAPPPPPAQGPPADYQ